MAVREARWDCMYCGTKGNLGRDKSCHQCGRSRPGGTKFYLPGDAEEVTDEKLLEQAGKGPDWICAFCGTSNKSEATTCRSCGAAREGTSEQQEVKTYAVGEAPTTGDMDLEEKPPAREPTPSGSKTGVKLIAIAVVAILAVICIGFIAFMVFGGSDASATVEGFEWQRAIEIEAFRTVTEEDWSVPAGGRVLSERQEKHHDEEILDHVNTREEVCGQIDLGDGFFQDKICTIEEPVYRQEPVYQPFYTYEIDKWIVIRTLQENGSDHSPFWPRADLSDGEREGNRIESYRILFKDSDGEIHTYTADDLEEWEKFESNQGVVLKLNAFGGISEIER